MLLHHELISRIATKAGVEEDRAERIARAVLAAFAEQLGRAQAESLADDLPRTLGAALREVEHGQSFDAPELYRRVAKRLRVREALAMEFSVAVGQTLAESVGEEIAGKLRQDASSPDIARLLTPGERDGEGDAPVHLHPERRTLAEGVPGARTSLEDVGWDSAQDHSVREENPHGETKLSSARGITQEREGRTLAEGRPRSEQPLSEAEKQPE